MPGPLINVLNNSPPSLFVGPITSISVSPVGLSKSYERILLVGSGCFLSVFSLNSPVFAIDPELYVYEKILVQDRIHHIKILENHHQQRRPSLEGNSIWSLVCGGGREFSICSIEKSENSFIFNKTKVFVAHDWIVDVNFYYRPSYEYAQIALLTAHNRIELYKYKVDELPGPEEMGSIACHDSTLLLSGQMRITEQNQLITYSIAGGSISGNITLWEWIPEKQFQSVQKVQATLTGHRGAIYDLSFSPLGEKLCTASEDRTLRVWDLQYLKASPSVLWGHLARAWRVHWWSDEQLTSVGEDCRTLTWNLTPAASEDMPQSEFSPKPFSVIEGNHDGRSIWSVTHDPVSGTLLTGGADGRICSSLIKPRETPENSPKKITSPHKIPIKSFNISSDNAFVLYVCQDGSVFKHILFNATCTDKLVYRHRSIFNLQCHVAFSPQSNRRAFIATNAGNLVHIDNIDHSEALIELYDLKITITMFKVYEAKNAITGLAYDCKQHACLLYEMSEVRFSTFEDV